METTDVRARILETKRLIRRVRTPAGARRFGQPIGSIIERDPIPTFTRRRKRREASGRDDQRPDVSMVQNAPHERSVDVTASSVAPTPELPGVSEDDLVPRSRVYKSSYESRVDLYTNEPPMRSQLDLDYLANATAKEAAQDLIEMGAQLRLSREFLKDREFMVSLAETTRIHEEMFPGFVYRHGNFYAGRRNMGGGGGGVVAYNRTIARRDAEDDTIDKTAAPDFVYGTNSGHYLNGPSTGFQAHDLSRNASPEMTQSITVFLGDVLDKADSHLDGGHRSRDGESLGFFAANDWWTEMGGQVGPRGAGMIYLMTHEFGHAINNTVSGNMSFEIDGWEDPDQYKRRWYAEYYNNAQMDLLEDMGVFKRTKRRYEADHLKDEADHYKNVILRNEQYLATWESFMAEARSRAIEDAIRADPKANVINSMREIVNDYDLPKWFKEDVQTDEEILTSYGFAMTLRRYTAPAPESHDVFSMITKNRPVSSESMTILDFMGGGGGTPTFDLWEKHHYINDVNIDAWNNLVSGYASKKVVEFEAETWASYMLDTKTTKATQRWGTLVHDMYSWWVEDDMDPEFGLNNDKE